MQVKCISTVVNIIFRRYLDLSLTPTILPQDAINVFIAVHSHPEGINVAYDFLMINWRELDPL
jgi:hypothetical protein